MESCTGPSSTGIPAGPSLGTFSTNRNSESWGSWFGKNMKERCQEVQSGSPLINVTGPGVLAPSNSRAKLTDSFTQTSLLADRRAKRGRSPFTPHLVQKLHLVLKISADFIYSRILSSGWGSGFY